MVVSMGVPYSPLAIANGFVARFADKNGVEHMKLQKLVYFSYGWWLWSKGLDGERLTAERPEVWRYGPVFPNLYNVLKIFGRRSILEPQSAGPFDRPDEIDDDDDRIHALLRWVWSRYGHLSSFALSDMTHKPGTPWHRMATENDFCIARCT